jgi:hypothetical protein
VRDRSRIVRLLGARMLDQVLGDGLRCGGGRQKMPPLPQPGFGRRWRAPVARRPRARKTFAAARQRQPP